jgi:hypothetical protein
MAADRNFRVSWTLAEVNTVRRAVERQRADAERELIERGAGRKRADIPVAEREELERLEEEVNRLATILQRDL